MKKQFTRCAIAALAFVTATCMAVSAQTAASTFSIAKKTQIPGEILKPGSYSIAVLDHLSDRMVVRVENTEGKRQTVFLAVPKHGVAGVGATGAVIWKADLNGVPAMRGFAFSQGNEVEFVYPKAVAADLAKANADRVIAMDPQSEGRPALRKMSPEDMKMINLWMLSLTTVGPSDKTPAIEAQRYQGTAEATVVAAQVPTPTPSHASVPMREVAQLQVPQLGPSRANASPHPKRRPVISSLPHTGSSLPLVMLIGFSSLAVATASRLLLRRSRVRSAESA